MNRSQDEGQSWRPRERARWQGLEVLSDVELVALILGTGRQGEPALAIAAALVEEHGLDGLAKLGTGAFAERAGVGEAKGARLAAAFELSRRAAGTSFDPRVPFRDSEAVAAWGRARLGRLEHEELWCLALDGGHRARAARCIARGGLHGIGLHVRDPLRMALREAASGVVLVHNHPSGDPAPSEEDVAFTTRFAEACELVATPLLDHVIVARHKHASLLGLGLLSHYPVKRAKAEAPRRAHGTAP